MNLAIRRFIHLYLDQLKCNPDERPKRNLERIIPDHKAEYTKRWKVIVILFLNKYYLFRDITMLNNETNAIIFALLSAFFAALTTIFAKIGVEAINPNVATAVRTVVILVMVWGWVFAKGQLETLLTISLKTLLFLVLSGLSTGLSWLFYFRALQVGKASLVAPLDKSSLVLVLIFSAIFLKEQLTLQVILGTALIVVGTLVLIF